MNSKLFIFAFCAVFVTAIQAGTIVLPTVKVLQGPSSKTTIIGPDGSSVSSSAPGGTVVTDDSALVPAAPAALAVAPETVVAGPAGSILTTYTAAGPAVVPAVVPTISKIVETPIIAPVVAESVAVKAIATPIVEEVNEGDYVPDNTEQLYDDGSYKGE